MKVRTIIQKKLPLITSTMHAKRRNALATCVYSLLSGSMATVTNIGRGVDSYAFEKHRIKQADRLLSNSNLYQERHSIYQALITQTVGVNKQPIILLDWSDLDTCKRHFLLRASLASHGRGLCLYEEVYPVEQKEKPTTHMAFLKKLKQLLPDDCRPIIVSDAGFKNPWFKSVLAIGWDFVGRVRKPCFYSTDGEQWQCITELYKQATGTAKSLSGKIAKRNPLACELVLIKQKSKGRVSLNASGEKKQSSHSKKHSQSAEDPWLIATSLVHTKTLAKRIVKIYRMRMQIEEGFRDMKSHRFGRGFEYNKTKDIKRLTILILLTTIAHWLLMILGMVATLENTHRRYQANSIKTYSVLSLVFIGYRVVVDKGFKVKIKRFSQAINKLKMTALEDSNRVL
jgi:hypothetical protein